MIGRVTDLWKSGSARLEVALLGVIILLGVHWRWPMMTIPLGVDELWHYSIANTATLGDFINVLKSAAHPPLSFLPMKLFLLVGREPVYVRMFSFLVGVAGIVLCWLIVKRASHTKWLPFIGAFLVAVGAGFIEQAVAP